MKILSLISLFFSFSSYAVQFSVENICDETYALNENIRFPLPSSAADITLHALELFAIDYSGNESGISSMFGTITGLDSYEVLADNHMFVYGWCYEIDGIQPSVIMGDFILEDGKHQSINWFYGYAEFLNGQWLSYCTPVNKNPRDFICRN